MAAKSGFAFRSPQAGKSITARQWQFAPVSSWYQPLCAAIVAALLLLVGTWTHPASAAEDEYRLNVQDKVRLKVYEWRASRDEIYEWVALNAEYAVGAAGQLTLPLIGEVTAAGSTPKEVSKVIGERLRARIGLAEAPDVAIEVVQYRPIYVTGHVEKPGEYNYKPGLTVLQAVTLGGGILRGAENVGSRLEREIITAKGEIDLLANEYTLLLARKARLEAELKRADTIEYPATLVERQKEPGVKLLMEQEQQIFQARKQGLETQLTALAQLKSFLEKEIVSLTGQLGKHDTQMQLVRQELETVTGLTEKGLATAPRRLAMERSVAQYEADHMRLESSILRARQDLSRTEINILELHNKRASEVTSELQATQAKLDQISQKSETSEKLLYESEVIAPRYLSDRGRFRRARPKYTIFRPDAGGSAQMEATETTTLQPGDTVKVELPSSEDGPLALPRDEPPRLQQFSQDLLTRLPK